MLSRLLYWLWNRKRLVRCIKNRQVLGEVFSGEGVAAGEEPAA
jgi:hypothetical protein